MKFTKRVKPRLFLVVDGKSAIHLNFQPFLETLNLYGNVVLMHWNRLHRLYGYYDVLNDEYHVHTANKTIVNVIGENKEISLNNGTLPTACVVYYNAKVVLENGILKIDAI